LPFNISVMAARSIGSNIVMVIAHPITSPRASARVGA
jgi:hypothetical protein